MYGRWYEIPGCILSIKIDYIYSLSVDLDFGLSTPRKKKKALRKFFENKITAFL